MTDDSEWHPERHPNYDACLSQACSQIRTELDRMPRARAELFTDPRAVHRRLYAPFTPADHPEYAGTYRGTPGTSLATRRAGAESFTGQRHPIAFEEPERVASAMDAYQKLFPALSAKAAQPFDARLDFASVIFLFFGKIHPFLDGNGHVQRLILTAACKELGMALKASWTIHPRPYDLEFAKLLETYHLHGGDRGPVARYLSGFIEL